MLVKLYEKVRQKYYRNPVDRLREKGAVIGNNVHIYDGGEQVLTIIFVSCLP